MFTLNKKGERSFIHTDNAGDIISARDKFVTYGNGLTIFNLDSEPERDEFFGLDDTDGYYDSLVASLPRRETRATRSHSPIVVLSSKVADLYRIRYGIYTYVYIILSCVYLENDSALWNLAGYDRILRILIKDSIKYRVLMLEDGVSIADCFKLDHDVNCSQSIDPKSLGLV